MNTAELTALPAELRDLVHWSSALLGDIIKKEAGEKFYRQVEDTRKKMAALRRFSESVDAKHDSNRTANTINECYASFSRLKPAEQYAMARAYTLLLELTNSCESAYRSLRLQKIRPLEKNAARPDAIIYVLTAHPTEARAPDSIAIFHQIQRTLQKYLGQQISRQEAERNLRHELALAWRIALVRERAPKVLDEAEHVYTTLCHPSILSSLLSTSQNNVPVYIRSWVGGDKDGHPGVDEKVLMQSLGESRRLLLSYARSQIRQVYFSRAKLSQAEQRCFTDLRNLEKQLTQIKKIRAGDGARLKKFKQTLARTALAYQKNLGELHPSLRRLRQLCHLFPAMVIPLELRESSDVLIAPRTKPIAIEKMLRQIKLISRGGEPLWYARGLIISMTLSIQHLRAAEELVRSVFGKACLPIIPLFEQVEALQKSAQICQELIHDPRLGDALRRYWGNQLEIMVGYSDSAKEAGVLSSRWEIATAMHKLEKICGKEKVRPLFFQGSGGSVARGGGLVQDQTAWLPHSALTQYKVTIQGEMVERSFASPEITRGQVERIAQSVGLALKNNSIAPHSEICQKFAHSTEKYYRQCVAQPQFLKIIESATPYSQLRWLKIGSRPTRRSVQFSLSSLRAIPWVLCWTQTRIFFPTWWGIGSSWKALSPAEKKELQAAAEKEPVFFSYLHALAFTLAKCEPDIWNFYLEHSTLSAAEKKQAQKDFQDEMDASLDCVLTLQNKKDLLWFRPWLGASIKLRSPLIHPLNVLQVIAQENSDSRLFRLTVAGISAGLLNTG